MTEIDLAKLGRLAHHLLPSDDLTLVVLKGHLLVEELLEDIVISHCRSPDILRQSQIGFATKLLFAKALSGADLPVLWVACSRLNSLRNALAHKLDHPDTQNRLQSFLMSLNAPGIFWDETTDQLLDFRHKVIFLYGALQAIRDPVNPHRLEIAV